MQPFPIPPKCRHAETWTPLDRDAKLLFAFSEVPTILLCPAGMRRRNALLSNLSANVTHVVFEHRVTHEHPSVRCRPPGIAKLHPRHPRARQHSPSTELRQNSYFVLANVVTDNPWIECAAHMIHYMIHCVIPNPTAFVKVTQRQHTDGRFPRQKLVFNFTTPLVAKTPRKPKPPKGGDFV